jgi:hypothetical protein
MIQDKLMLPGKILSMKKIALWLLLMTLLSCDNIIQYYFFVKNNCNESIEVTVIDYKNDKKVSVINPAEEKLVYSAEGLNKHRIEKVEYVFSSIIITMGSDTAKPNFIDKDKWQMNIISREIANCYLTIDETSFSK